MSLHINPRDFQMQVNIWSEFNTVTYLPELNQIEKKTPKKISDSFCSRRVNEYIILMFMLAVPTQSVSQVEQVVLEYIILLRVFLFVI